MQTVRRKVRRQINPKLRISGILLTMTDSRTTTESRSSNLFERHAKVFERTTPAPSCGSQCGRQSIFCLGV